MIDVQRSTANKYLKNTNMCVIREECQCRKPDGTRDESLTKPRESEW